MAPFARLFAATFVASDSSKLGSQKSVLALASLSQEISKTGDLSELCALLGAEPLDLLTLKHNLNGIRGVYVQDAVSEGDVILRIPLSSCLRDDEPPPWLRTDNENDDEKSDYAVVVEGWVTRLTACLLEAQRQDKKSKAMQTWLDLLPTDLREILPVHWDAHYTEGSRCSPLQMAVDSGYFARAGPIQDLLECSEDSELGLTQHQIEDALDLVQTRSCRAESSDGTPYMRVMVPIFDMINHDRENNAEFFREGEDMLVRATRDIQADNEVFINYGQSTSPAWKCLFSYGFVPLSECIYEDDAAEIKVDGMGIEVGPTEIPFELVQYEARQSGQFDPEAEVEFSSEIGERIIDRLEQAAKELETPLQFKESDIIIERSLAALRESNRRTILACAGGLREYVQDMS